MSTAGNATYWSQSGTGTQETMVIFLVLHTCRGKWYLHSFAGSSLNRFSSLALSPPPSLKWDNWVSFSRLMPCWWRKKHALNITLGEQHCPCEPPSTSQGCTSLSHGRWMYSLECVLGGAFPQAPLEPHGAVALHAAPGEHQVKLGQLTEEQTSCSGTICNYNLK